jgi:hypothetical protein
MKPGQTFSMATNHETVVMLGSGYLARFMCSLTTSYRSVLHTSRDPDSHLTWLPQKQRLRFDLADSSTWSNIPLDADLLWSFPAAPLASVQAFASRIRPLGRLVIVGSTSAYDVGGGHEYPPPWINESAPVDLGKPRVQGEEFLRTTCGAILLRTAGIYGPGRHPYEWIKSGRVLLSDKYVNLIHVEDLAAVCVAALKCARPGDVYNVSDGTPRTWADIGRTLHGHALVEPQAGGRRQASGKRINTSKLRALLQEAGTSIGHPDLFRALEELEQASGRRTER